jgi:hypothetical protein
MAADKHSMNHAETLPDEVAKTVFWVIALSTLVFVIAVLILIR